MRLINVECLARSLMVQHGLAEWGFAFSRKHRVLGECYHRSMRIELSKTYAELNDEHNICDTLLHEIAHALVGPGHGHDIVWKAQAMAIGAIPDACDHSDAKIAAPYTATCPRCSKVHYKFRKPHSTRPYSC